MNNDGLTGSELYSERTFPTNFDVLRYNSISRRARNQIYQRAIEMMRSWAIQTRGRREEGESFELSFSSYIVTPSKRQLTFSNAMTNLKQRRGVLSYKDLLSEPALNSLGESDVYYAMHREANFEDESDFFILLTHADQHNYLLCLDLIELLSKWINAYYEADFSREIDDMINDVFRSNGIGYELIENQIIHKANDVVHREVVRPSLHFLSDPTYQGANEEMLRAFSDFRNSNYHGAIQNASNAFESTMKIIIETNGWEVISRNGPAPRLNNASANILIHTISENSGIERFHRAALRGLKELLQALSTLRNDHTGHGQGSERRETYIQHCEFALHSAAANILYLIKVYG